MKKKSATFRIIFLVFAFILLSAFFLKNAAVRKTHTIMPTLTPSPTPFIFTTYSPPTIVRKDVYRIAMLGDSMTAALGPHGGGLSEYMNSLYKKSPQDPQRIIIDNYAKSSSILAISNELTQKITVSEYTFGPLLSIDYDLILVESYGYNPLSQFGIEEGIKQQDKALDILMETLITARPNAVVIFVTTISPNRENYAKVENPNSTVADRAKQADERIAYIKNHIAYAKSHNIPLINIYQDSLLPNGDGNMLYISPTDDIHPSFTGIDFIGHEIGNFIFNNKILPQ